MEKKNMKKQDRQKNTFGKMMPQAPDAEKAVIGALITFTEAFDKVSFLTTAMFYNPRYQILFEAILSLKKKDAPVDIITVSQELATMGKADEVPLFVLTEVTMYIQSLAHINTHALIILDKYLQRQILQFSLELQSQATDDTNDVGDVLFNAGKKIEKLQEILIGQKEASTYQDISRLFYEDIQVRMNKFLSGTQTGVTTGLTDLDRITSGWQPSELVILAARPSMGKTAMALHFAHSASRAGVPVVIFSLEMSKVNIYNRSVLSACNNLDPRKLKTGNLMNDLPSIDKSVGQLCKLPIYVDDNSDINMSYIRSASRLLHKKRQCGMVIIDYLQLIAPEKEKYGNREQEVSAMSRASKLLAKELNIPVILLSQLNREVERRQEKRPQLSDLRESGAIEQDADMVIFIHRPEYYKEVIHDSNGKPIENAGELIIAKNRNGATGNVRFKHNTTLSRIFDYREKTENEQLNIF